MNTVNLALRVPLGVALIVCLSMLPACTTITVSRPGQHPDTTLTAEDSPSAAPATVQEIPSPSPEPTPTPTLPLDAFWVGVEGRASQVAAVSLDGTVRPVRLPLNEDQSASNVVATRDGQTLAYLVWDADGGQHGIAAWNPAEPNARFIALPLDGYRIIALFAAGDASALAYVQVAEGAPLEEAAWQVDVISLSGGDARTVASRETLADILPPAPFAWPQGGPLLLTPAVPGGSDAGIYAVNTQTGGGKLLFPVEGQVIASPALSPDGTQLAYLAYSPAENEPAATAVTVRSLRLDEVQTMNAPPGQAVYGVRWHPDGRRLLLDVVEQPPEEAGQAAQRWALAGIGQDAPWPQSQPGPGRDRLFDYEALGEGVVYTLLPQDGQWALYHLPDLGGEAEAQAIGLESIAQESGAPVIIRLPYHP